MQNYAHATAGKRITLLDTTTLAGAVADQVGSTFANLAGMNYIGLVAVFVRAGGGTTAKFWVQTSFDGGTTWHDIANFAFTTSTLTKVAGLSAHVAATHATPTDATLADNTINNGLIGDRLRVKYTTTGTYTGASTIKISAIVKG